MWLTDWFFRRGRGVLEVVAGRMLAPGLHGTLPTAGIDFEGAIARTSTGLWGCEPSGAGHAWISLGQHDHSDADDGGTIPSTSVTGLALVHLNTTAFSAVTSVSVNDVFSATYDTYKVFLQIDAHATAAANTLMRFRVGGADDAGAAEYTYAGWTVTSAGASGAGASAGATSMIAYFAAAGTTTDVGGDYTIFQPFNASARSTMVGSAFALRSGTDNSAQTMGGQRGIDKSHTGFSIVSSSGNIAGTVRTFGVRNS
jgi:hypothetical protein